jgi:hypothetical protein
VMVPKGRRRGLRQPAGVPSGRRGGGPRKFYAPPIKTNYYRFALIFRGVYKTSLYAELYGDKKWGFGLMFGRVMTD